MKKLLFIFLFCTGLAKAQDSDPTLPETDAEQQQLEWCFEYSNRLGFDIDYIAYPQLYAAITEWIGTPYRYSGNDRNGIDCSGFVAEMYLRCFGKKLEGSSHDMFDKVEEVKEKDLQEGDLLFFKIRRGRISHVGIYLGGNKFVHSSTQRGVIISDLNEPYYEKYFYKGGRIPL